MKNECNLQQVGSSLNNNLQQDSWAVFEQQDSQQQPAAR
jgi:hypothetical protein